MMLIRFVFNSIDVTTVHIVCHKPQKSIKLCVTSWRVICGSELRAGDVLWLLRHNVSFGWKLFVHPPVPQTLSSTFVKMWTWSTYFDGQIKSLILHRDFRGSYVILNWFGRGPGFKPGTILNCFCQDLRVILMWFDQITVGRHFVHQKPEWFKILKNCIKSNNFSSSSLSMQHRGLG